ncbi:MAG TPA: PAS domain S-box protein [Anaerovoracaceae bacterium]|nr:PAS domain S-box protein [Anaerovoracaceae bacterium]
MEGSLYQNLPDILETVFNNTHEAMMLVEHRNGGFRVLMNNVTHQQLTGFYVIEGMTLPDLVGEELGEKLQEYYRQCIKTGQKVTYEQAYEFTPGKKVFQTEVTPVPGRDGISYLLCSSKDVTDLKEAQEENRMLTRRLQSMFMRHSAVMLIIEPVSGRIIDANPAACNFYGYSREELLRLSINDISMLPDEEVADLCMMAAREKQYYYQCPHCLKNGEVRLVDVFTCPIPDEENEVLLYSIMIDATDREVYRLELFHEKELLSTTLRSIGDGVVTTDSYGTITSLNSVAQEITGWTWSEAEGKLFTDVFRLLKEETEEPVEDPIAKVLETGRIIGLANHTALRNRQGKLIPIADSAAPIKTEDGEIYGVVMVFRDVTTEKEQSRQIRFLSYHDPLTGLYNRRYIEEAVSRLDTAENLPISVIMGDVNGLKITNDVFGHKAGDSLLQHVAETLQASCRKDDLIARWGGDEFVVIMPRTDIITAEQTISEIKKHFETASEQTLRLSLSLGCAAKEDPETELQNILQAAEEYMYHQKLLDGKSYRNAIINTLLATLYEKSIETEEHTERLGYFCTNIGRKLQLSSKEMDELSLLAVLHDIGKVGISRSILQKPAQLVSNEWEEMKRHPEIGYRIAQATPELTIAADFILSHHERWDGSGYPRGLKAEDIPLVCRILAVADAYDAMTNDRVYRNAMSKNEAILELKKNAGTQFDPAIVDLFIETITQN